MGKRRQTDAPPECRDCGKRLMVGHNGGDFALIFPPDPAPDYFLCRKHYNDRHLLRWAIRFKGVLVAAFLMPRRAHEIAAAGRRDTAGGEGIDVIDLHKRGVRTDATGTEG